MFFCSFVAGFSQACSQAMHHLVEAGSPHICNSAAAGTDTCLSPFSFSCSPSTSFADVLEALKALNSGMNTIKRELEAELAHPSSSGAVSPPSQRQAAFATSLEAAASPPGGAKATAPPAADGCVSPAKDGDSRQAASSPFARMLLAFMANAEAQQEELKAAADETHAAVAATVAWLGEPPDPDPSPLFQLLRSFASEFDMAFAKVHRLLLAQKAGASAAADGGDTPARRQAAGKGPQ